LTAQTTLPRLPIQVNVAATMQILRPAHRVRCSVQKISPLRKSAYWEDAIGKAMRTPEAKKFAEINNWTIELIGSKELPIGLDKEHARLRGMLTEPGMAK
jgi:hypothetical protein